MPEPRQGLGPRALFLSILSALALTLSACEADAADDSVDSEPPASAPAEPGLPNAGPPLSEPGLPGASESAIPPAASGTAVTTGEVAQHGTVLTDGTGMTLYVFFEDAGGTSTCYDACAENWPPLTTEGQPAGEGSVNQALLGTTERDDGSLQVTYDGQPLYLYTGDSQPGDANGFGQGNVWYPVAPDGAPMDVALNTEPTTDGY
jgi:predicted lipoprotein with Yx(FWY)xxD motif